MRVAIKYKKIMFIFLAIIIRILMDYIYVKYICKRWAYKGFVLDINYNKLLISYVTTFIILIIIKEYKRHIFSHFIIVTLFFSMYMPIGVIYGLMNLSSNYYIIVNISFILLCVGTIYFNKNQERIEKKQLIYLKQYWLIIIISTFTFVAMTVQNFKNIDIMSVVNLSNVYAIRKKTTYYWGMNYIFSWQAKILNPYMITYSYITDKKFVKWIFVFFQIWLYILTGHKMVLFTLIIVVFILKFMHRLENMQILFINSLFCIYLLAVLEVIFFNKSYIIDLFIRRVMYVPALLGFYYYDFFSVHGFQMWKYTLFGRIFNIKTDFNIAPSFIIGKKYFNDVNMNAVSGYIGSEYMNGGFVGVILATIVLIVLFKVIDKCSQRLDNNILLVTLLTPVYTLWNSTLFTSILTGGFFIGIIILSQTKVKNENTVLNNR